MSNVSLALAPFPSGKGDVIAVVRLSRPERANAFSGEMVEELLAAWREVGALSRCRALLVCGKGKHFSAGADLEWMKRAAALSYEENLAESTRLQEMFETLASLGVPTIAAVHGASYGGAIGLLACCDIVVAESSSTFCLSEARLGMLSAVILPYIARRMRHGQLRRHILSARPFSAAEAHEFGLVDVVASVESFGATIDGELRRLLAGSPVAQASCKALLRKLAEKNFAQCPDTACAIAEARVSPDGQSGLGAFLGKTSPPWMLDIPEGWSTDWLSDPRS